jgi:hypothetical protein
MDPGNEVGGQIALYSQRLLKKVKNILADVLALAPTTGVFVQPLSHFQQTLEAGSPRLGCPTINGNSNRFIRCQA